MTNKPQTQTEETQSQETHTLTDEICHHIVTANYDQLSSKAVSMAHYALMDGIGVMLAASALSTDINPFLELAKLSDGSCKILGTQHKTGIAACALANGAMAHALDFEDAYDAAPCHPNAATIAALLAAVQHFPDVSGKKIISALAIGCDLVCRMGLSLKRPMEDGGWYPPPILGAFGATAAIAHLAGLSHEQTRSALSLALCQTTMPGEIKYSTQTNIRAVREAFGAQTAINSVLLARQGVVGFETPFEGKGGFFALFVDEKYDAEILTKDLGGKFYIEDLTFKLWPACRGTHAYIELALALQAEHNFTWQEVVSVDVTTAKIHDMLINPAARKQKPANSIDAKFSIPFTLASALVKGRVGLDEFSQTALADKDVLSLAALVRPHLGQTKEGFDISPFGGELYIHLRCGKILHGIKDPALGHPDNPLSREQLTAKFVTCAQQAPYISSAQSAENLAEQILKIYSAQNATTILAAL